MNPETISIPDCTLDNPVKNSSGKISFCLLPCLHKDERLQVKLPTRFKIYSHPGNGNGNDSFSLGISIPENSLEFFRDLQKHLNSLAMKKKKEVEKIGRSFARYDQGSFYSKIFRNFFRFQMQNAIPEICPRNGEDFIKIVGFSTA